MQVALFAPPISRFDRGRAGGATQSAAVIVGAIPLVNDAELCITGRICVALGWAGCTGFVDIATFRSCLPRRRRPSRPVCRMLVFRRGQARRVLIMRRAAVRLRPADFCLFQLRHRGTALKPRPLPWCFQRRFCGHCRK
ncbi:hypothetical protein KCP70_09080 [Salmonella enterica subsp. enterica]|nr:hypothetical protein KCP70_09080 [Salmonella enterica subsp. enterica]